MHRNKVFELAMEAGLFSAEVTVLMPKLERFSALIEREVRGDAKPVGYTNEGYKGMQYANAESYNQIRPDFIERNKLTAPLYKHPTPAVVAQLVEALEQLMSIVKIHSRATSNNFAWAEMDFAKEALAAAKENGL